MSHKYFTINEGKKPKTKENRGKFNAGKSIDQRPSEVVHGRGVVTKTVTVFLESFTQRRPTCQRQKQMN